MTDTSFMPFPKGDPPRATGDAEVAYRRGFTQGAAEILHIIKSGHGEDIGKIEEYVEEQLRAWRDDTSTAAFPPDFDFRNRRRF